MRPQSAVSCLNLARPELAGPSLACLVLAVFLNPFAAASGAESPGYEVVTRTVKYSDLDLNSRRDVATLYSRIKVAANQVCEPADSRSVDTFARLRHCKEQAIGQAVTAVRSTQLMSFHMAQIDVPVNR
jgi:UrcA family protein